MAASTSRRSLDPKTARVLHALYHLDKNQRKVLLKIAKRPLVKGICECALNTLKGNIQLSPQQKSKLLKHKHVLRKLASKSPSSWQGKKRIILQRGEGFLTALLAPILGTIISAIIPSKS